MSSVIEWVQSQKSETFHVFGDRCSCVVRGGERARRRMKVYCVFMELEIELESNRLFLIDYCNMFNYTFI